LKNIGFKKYLAISAQDVFIDQLLGSMDDEVPERLCPDSA
jgi:hypothetical protein